MVFSRIIDKNRLEEFGGLIPDFYHEGIASGELFAVASFDGGISEDSLVGVTVMGISGQWAQIMWYALTEEYDTPWYLSDLIKDRVADTALKGQAEGIFTVLTGPDRKEKAEVFSRNGFEIVESVSNVLEFEFGSINREKLPRLKHETDYLNLGKADHKILRILANHMANDERNIPVEIPVLWARYDQKLSLIRTENNEPVGVALVTVKKEEAVVELLYEKEPKGFLHMISALVEHAEKELGDSARIIVPVLDERLFDVLKVLAPAADRSEVLRAYMNFRDSQVPLLSPF